MLCCLVNVCAFVTLLFYSFCCLPNAIYSLDDFSNHEEPMQRRIQQIFDVFNVL
jgi:hypothetical protein